MELWDTIHGLSYLTALSKGWAT